MKEKDQYIWLKETNNYWKYNFELLVSVYGFFSFILAAILGVISFFMGNNIWIVSIILISLYFLGGILVMFLLYYQIICPKCGHNPSRKKNGKWASPRYLEGKFKKLISCPSCKNKDRNT
ncbi:MAG: hypothetical protein NE328_21760 [Lentisphaeraceae bacterium]|nr:hypothetical protein [Lentisphaeraceae bacterium]